MCWMSLINWFSMCLLTPCAVKLILIYKYSWNHCILSQYSVTLLIESNSQWNTVLRFNMHFLFTECMCSESLFSESKFRKSLYSKPVCSDAMFTESMFSKSLHRESILNESLFTDFFFNESLPSKSIWRESLYSKSIFIVSLFTESLITLCGRLLFSDSFCSLYLMYGCAVKQVQRAQCAVYQCALHCKHAVCSESVVFVESVWNLVHGWYIMYIMWVIDHSKQ